MVGVHMIRTSHNVWRQQIHPSRRLSALTSSLPVTQSSVAQIPARGSTPDIEERTPYQYKNWTQKSNKNRWHTNARMISNMGRVLIIQQHDLNPTEQVRLSIPN